MHIGLTYDLQTDVTDERQAEFDPPQTIEALRQALESLGYPVVLLGNARDLLREPERLRSIELVFNIAEGTNGRCREAWVPTLLDLVRVPYVGSDSLALSVGLDKHVTKQLAVAQGLATPRWIRIDHPGSLSQHPALPFPVIVKPRWEGSGRGIDAGAVVHDMVGLRARVEWLYQRCQQPMLIEEFLPGGELTVCVIGNDPPVALPAIQRPLDAATHLSYHVVPQASQWECPLLLDEALDREARRIALVMFETLGCCDVARVDLRVDAHGQPSFLEINPLPSFDPEGSVGLIAEYLGIAYSQLIGHVLHAALTRSGCEITPACRAASDAVRSRLRNAEHSSALTQKVRNLEFGVRNPPMSKKSAVRSSEVEMRNAAFPNSALPTPQSELSAFSSR